MSTAHGAPEGDGEIIHWMVDGDVRGLEALLRVHGGRIKACLRVEFRLSEGDHALEDAIHDAAMILFDRPKRLDPYGNLGGYYYVTARRELRRHLAKRNGHHHLLDGAEDRIPAPDQTAAPASDLADRIAMAIAGLPDKEREILSLDIASNFRMPASAIAQALNTTPQAVYSLRNRTKGRLSCFL